MLVLMLTLMLDVNDAIVTNVFPLKLSVNASVNARVSTEDRCE